MARILLWQPRMDAANQAAKILEPAAQDRAVATRRRWRRGARALLLAAVVITAASVGLARWLSAERSVDADRLRIAEVRRGLLVRDAAVTGRVVAAVSPTLYAPAAGTVTLEARAGDAIRRGDVVAVIDSPDLASQLARERAVLAELEAELGSATIAAQEQRLAARREADEAGIERTAAARDLARIEGGFAKGAIPELELLRARDALASAEIRKDNAGAARRLAGEKASFLVTTRAAQRDRQALVVADLERRVNELRVRAPVDGVVGTVAVADRARVPADSAIMTVVDLAQLELELEVPQAYADDLGIDMPVEVTIGDGKAAGRIASVAPEVVSQSVLAQVRFDAQPAGLRQSQRVSARILLDERPDVVMVPRGPFLDAHGGRVIYVVDGDVARRRDIRVGVTSVSHVEILEGLAPGERVVIAGSDRFEDAGSVRIND